MNGINYYNKLFNEQFTSLKLTDLSGLIEHKTQLEYLNSKISTLG